MAGVYQSENVVGCCNTGAAVTDDVVCRRNTGVVKLLSKRVGILEQTCFIEVARKGQ